MCLFHRQTISYVSEHQEQVTSKVLLLSCGSKQSSYPLECGYGS